MSFYKKGIMKRNGLLNFFFATLLCIFFALLGVGCKEDSKYFIATDWKETEVGANNTIHVEYGNTLTAPIGTVTNKNGEEFDVVVKHSLVDETGKDITSRIPIYNLSEGMRYTLTYHAETTEVNIKDLVYTIECSDTQAPVVTVFGYRAIYNVGETIAFSITNVTDVSGYKEESVKLTVKSATSGQEIALTNNAFVAEQSGEYQLIVQAEDNTGNVLNDVKSFKIAAPYLEPVVDNVLWGFEDDNAFANVSTIGDSDPLEYAISSEKVENGGKALKLSLKADATVEFLLRNGNQTPVTDMERVEFRVYSTNLIDKFSVYSLVDYTEIKFDYKILKNNWMTISFDPEEYYPENASIDAFQIKIWTEEDADLYIDGIYYSDKVLPWQDPTLASNVIADFDEIEYADRLGPLTAINNSSFGGIATIHTAGDTTVPTGASGGVLKLASTSICAQTDDKIRARDGFYYDCGGKIYLDDIQAFYFRMNVDGYQYASMHFALVTDLGTNYYWATLPNPTSTYDYFMITKADMINAPYACLDADAKYFTGFFIRMYKSTDDTVNTYFDEIGYIPKGAVTAMSSGTYEFNKAADLTYAASDSGAGFIITKDGEADVLKISSNYAAVFSGASLNFANLDISRYESIKITLKAPTGTDIYVNDVYGTYKTEKNYIELDVKALAESVGVDTLYELRFGRKTSRADIFIDKIELVEKADSYNYDFSSASDPDKNAMAAINGGTVDIVADADAVDGFALKAVTVAHAEGSGVKIALDKNITTLGAVLASVKTSGAISIGVNGQNVITNATYATYQDVDLMALYQAKFGALLNEIEYVTFTSTASDVQIFVDKIVFVGIYDDVTYQFASTDTADMKAVEGYGETVPAVVADGDAYDGYALSVTGNEAEKGLLIKFSNVDTSQIYQLRMRIKTAGTAQLLINGDEITTLSSATYTEVNLMALYATKTGVSLAHLETVTLYIIDATGGSISIDYVTFFNYGATMTLYDADLHGTDGWSTNHGAILGLETVSDKIGLKMIGNGGWTGNEEHNQYVYTLSTSMDLSVIESISINFYTTSGYCVFEAPLTYNYDNIVEGVEMNTWRTSNYPIPTANNPLATGTVTDFNFLNTNADTTAVYIHSISVTLKKAN